MVFDFSSLTLEGTLAEFISSLITGLGIVVKLSLFLVMDRAEVPSVLTIRSSNVLCSHRKLKVRLTGRAKHNVANSVLLA